MNTRSPRQRRKAHAAQNQSKRNQQQATIAITITGILMLLVFGYWVVVRPINTLDPTPTPTVRFRTHLILFRRSAIYVDAFGEIPWKDISPQSGCETVRGTAILKLDSCKSTLAFGTPYITRYRTLGGLIYKKYNVLEFPNDPCVVEKEDFNDEYLGCEVDPEHE